jgi:hypothetical protein
MYRLRPHCSARTEKGCTQGQAKVCAMGSASSSAPAAQAQHQVQRGLLLDVIVSQRAAVFQLLAGKDQALLVGRDALLVLRAAVKAGASVLGCWHHVRSFC